MTKKLSACPSWLDLSEDRRSFVFVPQKADTVRKIFELCVSGLGSYSIAKLLERQKIPAFGPSGKWDSTTIDNILKSRAVLGEYQPKSYAGGSKKGIPIGDPVPNYYPSVVDRVLFAEAQQARRRHLVTGRGRKGNELANLFTGLATCAYCGSAIKFHRNGPSRNMICEQVLRDLGCVRVGWSYKGLENSILSFISHPALFDSTSHQNRKSLETLVSQIRLLHEAQAELLDLRLELAATLRRAISELKLWSAGEKPALSHPEARIRSDHPGRFFEIRLWNGTLYRGQPVG
jgi:Recombinase